MDYRHYRGDAPPLLQKLERHFHLLRYLGTGMMGSTIHPGADALVGEVRVGSIASQLSSVTLENIKLDGVVSPDVLLLILGEIAPVPAGWR